LTARHCPACDTPLFQVGEQLRCPRCNKAVVVVKEGEEEKTVVGLTTMNDLEQTLLMKLYEYTQDLKEEKNPAKMLELGAAINVWLEALERVRRMQRTFS
jgi:uncharacterized Zn finger protein (UPF0148 family)